MFKFRVYGNHKDYLKKRVFCYFLLEIWLWDFGSGLGIISDKGWLVQGLKGRDGSWKGVFTVKVCVRSLSVDCWLHGVSNGGRGFKTKETLWEAPIPKTYLEKSTFTKLRFVFVLLLCVFKCLKWTMMVVNLLVVFCVTRTKGILGNLLEIASKS